jgi:hypothetical protein
LRANPAAAPAAGAGPAATAALPFFMSAPLTGMPPTAARRCRRRPVPGCCRP